MDELLLIVAQIRILTVLCIMFRVCLTLYYSIRL